jgi:3-oxoacyl-[acyl-carrier-protein] synthase-1
MTADDIVVAGLGITTSVGLSPSEVDASVRAGSSRFVESKFRDHRFQPFTVAELPEAALPPLAVAVDATAGVTARERRLLRIATAALDQCAQVASEMPFGAALFAAIPELATTIPIDDGRLLDLLGTQTKTRFDRAASKAAFRGRAGGLAAVDAAATALRDGKAKAVFVCGVDTFVDPFVLGTLDLEGRVKSTAHLDGFIPGEGAAVVLLVTRATADQHRLTSTAVVSASATGVETGHLYSEEPYRGDGLATLLHGLFGKAAGLPPVADVYSSMNGESYWGQEWGVGFIRNSDAIDSTARIHHPADCFGDVGAASGPLLVALASLALRSGRASAPTLVYASSDYGDRAAVLLTSA